MDKYKIKLTKQATEHLQIIRDYISIELKAPDAAKNMLKILKKKIFSLETMPQRIKCVNEKPWHDLGFRKVKVKNYYIYFWIDENKRTIQINAIIYIKRDKNNLLEQL
mgnify:CR=1 FL=1